MECTWFFSKTAFLLLITSQATFGSQCSLQSLDVTDRSTYVIYGARHDGFIFSFDESDVHLSRKTPDEYLRKVIAEVGKGIAPSKELISEMTLSESEGVVDSILHERRHHSNENTADAHGVPVSSEFIYVGDSRSRRVLGTQLTLFTLSETAHHRYYLKHDDQLGLHGSFRLASTVTQFLIKGRRLKNIELRQVMIKVTANFTLLDSSRLWNDGEDLDLNDELDRFGEEWKFAFGSKRSRGECIRSRGLPGFDLHILWRYSRRVKFAYASKERKNNLLRENEMILNYDDREFNDVIFVGVRNGILFMCPVHEGFVSVNQMFNEAGFYTRENREMITWKETNESKIYLLSQNSKEVFVVAVDDHQLYYKAFTVSRAAFRAHTLRLEEFIVVPSLQSSNIAGVDIHDNSIFVDYAAAGVWRISLYKTQSLPELVENGRSEITDGYTGESMKRTGVGHIQLYNGMSTVMTNSHIKYMSTGEDIRSWNLTLNHYDSLLLLHPSIYCPNPSYIVYGIHKCTTFVVSNWSLLDDIPQGKADRCLDALEVRVFYANAHIVIAVRRKGEDRLYYDTEKPSFAHSNGKCAEKWFKDMPWNWDWQLDRSMHIGLQTSLSTCYVADYALRCFTVEPPSSSLSSHSKVKRVSRNWLTDQDLPSDEVSKEEMYGLGSESCEWNLVNVLTDDGKDLIFGAMNGTVNRMKVKEGAELNFTAPDHPKHTQYFKRRERMLTDYAPFSSTANEYDSFPVSWVGDDVVFRIGKKSCPECDIVYEHYIRDLAAREESSKKLSSYVAISGQRIQEKQTGPTGLRNDLFAQEIVKNIPPAEEIREPIDDEEKETGFVAVLPCTGWQKTGVLVCGCVSLAEVIILLAAVLTVTCIAKPSMRAQRIQQGIQLNNMAVKERALKRLNRLKLDNVSGNREGSLKEKRRKDGAQDNSSEDSSRSAGRDRKAPRKRKGTPSSTEANSPNRH